MSALVTSKDRVYISPDDEQTHAVAAKMVRYYDAGTIQGDALLRARCGKPSANWLPRIGDVVTCPKCCDYLRRCSLAFAARARVA